MGTPQVANKQNGKTINYGFKRELNVAFDAALARTRTALASEGFGVLCEIDIKEKLKEKLGVVLENYVILGACNPALAYEALQQEVDLGLLLPCNVVVYQQGPKTVVSVIDAAKMMTVVGNEQLDKTAQVVNEKLRRVVGEL